jgi:glycosyltransferase involved in cell wall biosynthesis
MNQRATARRLVIFGAGDNNAAWYFVRAASTLANELNLTVDFASTRNQIGALTPNDILLIVDPITDWFGEVSSIKCKKAVYLVDLHQSYDLRRALGFWGDAVFCAQKDYIERLRADGVSNVQFCPLASDPHLHFAPGLTRDYDVGFVGKLGPPHLQRARTLSRVLSTFSTNDFWLWHSPRELGLAYSRSKVVINASINGDLNMRVFEAMAAGAALVTDRVGNGFGDFFNEETHYLGYDSVDEAVAQVRRLLVDDQLRHAIAQAAQSEVLNAHTYRHRMAFILDTLAATPHGASRAARASKRRVRREHAKLLAAIKRPEHLPALFASHGIDSVTAFLSVRASIAWVNSRVPISPNAIWHKLNALKSRNVIRSLARNRKHPAGNF